jgi:ribosomal protein L11 methyltransferase
MRVRLPSGFEYSVAPFLPWEKRRPGLLRIRADRAFPPSHVTTRLALHHLEETLGTTLCRSVLDVGCGSGVLALAALRLGALSAVGLDIDAGAVRRALANAAANGLESRTQWLVGTLTGVRATFDCVVANLPWEVLQATVEDFPRVLAAEGCLILSGFQDIHWPALVRRLGQLGLVIRAHRAQDCSFYGVPPSGSFTWMALAACKGGPNS